VNNGLFNNAITQTAKIAEQKTTADRKKRSRFWLLFSLLGGFRLLKAFLAAAE